jgi:hypothetical protein
MLPIVIGSLAFSYLNYQRKKQYEIEKLLPQSLHVQELNTAYGIRKFREVMSEVGFIVLHLDETLSKSILNYRSCSEEFFLLSAGT